MIRGLSNENSNRSLGLGPHLVGKQIDIHGHHLEICKQLGEGGFSFVYLVRNRLSGNEGNGGAVDIAITSKPFTEGWQSMDAAEKCRPGHARSPMGNHMVLKITSVHNTTQRHMAEKEAKLLQTLSHPSIVQVYDHGFRESNCDESNFNSDTSMQDSLLTNNSAALDSMNGNLLSPRLAQHLILMEYCEGGTAFDAIKRMKSSPPSLMPSSKNINLSHGFDLPSLVILFGQICNAVSYLHAQRPPIVHRDLKPVNFLIKNGAYKLCDFGSSVMGHTDLRTPESRRRAEEVVNRTTTQMFRAPEMVDLFMAKRLTQSTDVWALGCCLYSLAFLRDCFEEGSNLAILSCKFKIPDGNPYGDDLVDLIDRMLARDYKERADMSEVIMCLSALYSSRPLPKRRRAGRCKKEGKSDPRLGAYRTDGQGIFGKAPTLKKNIAEAKKLDPNSAAAKRKKASEGHKYKQNMPASHPSCTDHGRTPLDSASCPSSEDGSFHNFASFEKNFPGNFDISHAQDDKGSMLDFNATKASHGTFLSTFNNQCLISVEPSLPNANDSGNNAVDDSLNMIYQTSCVSLSATPTNPNHDDFNCQQHRRNSRATTTELPAFKRTDPHSFDRSVGGKKGTSSLLNTGNE